MKKKNKYSHFQVIDNGIVFDFMEEPEGGYTVSIPSLPGCVTYGQTFEKAMEMIVDAMEGCVTVAKEEGLFISEEIEKYFALKASKTSFVS